MNPLFEDILANIDEEMFEAKRIWYKNGKQEEWDKMWGITLKHRYENVKTRLEEASRMYDRTRLEEASRMYDRIENDKR